MGLPLMRNRRLPLAVSSEVISRMPKSTVCSSRVRPCCVKAQSQVFEVRLAHLVRPPELGIVDAQLGELFGREDDGAVFMRGELDGLLEVHARGGAGDDAVDGVIGGVVQLGVDGEVGRIRGVIGKMRDGHRVSAA